MTDFDEPSSDAFHSAAHSARNMSRSSSPAGRRPVRIGLTGQLPAPRSPVTRQPPQRDPVRIDHRLGMRDQQGGQVADRGRSGAVRPGPPIRTAAVVTPDSTSRLGQPTAFAPSMSVSNRSPTTIGRSEPLRSSDSRCMAGSGLPVTTGSCPVACCKAATSDPFPGSGPRGRRNRRVDVGRDPRHAAIDRDRALGELSPVQVGRVPLHHRGQFAVGRVDRDEPAFAQRHLQSGRADDQHPGARRKLLGQMPRRRLRGRDDLVGGRVDAQLRQVRRHRIGRAGGVVRDERQPQPVAAGGGQRLGRARDRGRADVDRPRRDRAARHRAPCTAASSFPAALSPRVG